MNLDQILLDEALLRQELQHILALVALQLDDLHGHTTSGSSTSNYQIYLSKTQIEEITHKALRTKAGTEETGCCLENAVHGPVCAPGQAQGHPPRYRCSKTLQGQPQTERKGEHQAAARTQRQKTAACGPPHLS